MNLFPDQDLVPEPADEVEEGEQVKTRRWGRRYRRFAARIELERKTKKTFFSNMKKRTKTIKENLFYFTENHSRKK